MAIQQAFAKALKQARKTRGLTQEDFSNVSSRTYVSSLERGIKSPTIEKVDSLAKAMKLHPLTLLALTYLIENKQSNPNRIIQQITLELHELLGLQNE